MLCQLHLRIQRRSRHRGTLVLFPGVPASQLCVPTVNKGILTSPVMPVSPSTRQPCLPLSKLEFLLQAWDSICRITPTVLPLPHAMGSMLSCCRCEMRFFVPTLACTNLYVEKRYSICLPDGRDICKEAIIILTWEANRKPEDLQMLSA